MVGKNPRFSTQGRVIEKAKLEVFFFFVFFFSRIHQLWDFSFMIPYSNKFNQLEVCFISMVPHFCAGGAGDREECSTSGLDRHNASLEISFLCINYPPSFHSVVATHTFLRLNSDVCLRFSLRENAPKNVLLGCQGILPKWHDFRLTTLIRLSHLAASHVDLRCRCFSHVGRIHWSVRS